MVAVHGCWFDDGERALLAERGAALAYNPDSNMFLGDGVTDVVDLVARGVRVALGTDGGCSNIRVSVFDEMRACALLAEGRTARDGQAIDAETCFAHGHRTAAARCSACPIGRIAVGLPRRPRLRRSRRSVAVARAVPGQERRLLALALAPSPTSSSRASRSCAIARSCKVPLADVQERVRALTRDWRRD